MAYEMVMPYHLHMPSYFLETFTEYPELSASAFEQKRICAICGKIEYQNYKSFSNILLVLL